MAQTLLSVLSLDAVPDVDSRVADQVRAVAKTAGETSESIRTTRGHTLRNLVASLGWHEGWVTLRSIAESLRLRSEGHISNLVKQCEEIFSENPSLLAYHDAALTALRA